jgi:hypothetical protein
MPLPVALLEDSKVEVTICPLLDRAIECGKLFGGKRHTDGTEREPTDGRSKEKNDRESSHDVQNSRSQDAFSRIVASGDVKRLVSMARTPCGSEAAISMSAALNPSLSKPSSRPRW